MTSTQMSSLMGCYCLSLSVHRPINFEFSKSNNPDEGLRIKIKKSNLFFTVTYFDYNQSNSKKYDSHLGEELPITKRVEASCDSALFSVKNLDIDSLE